MKFQTLLVYLALGLSLTAQSAQVIVPPPECPAYDRDLPINNRQVLHWKRTTKNQFRERGHVSGEVIDVYSDKNGHAHFSVQIGRYERDTIEVIYNFDFGRIPKIREGMQVQACGDYITSTAKSGPYPASPDGAILHWVHMNPRDKGHVPGYLMIDGRLYGQELPDEERLHADR